MVLTFIKYIPVPLFDSLTLDWAGLPYYWFIEFLKIPYELIMLPVIDPHYHHIYKTTLF